MANPFARRLVAVSVALLSGGCQASSTEQATGTESADGSVGRTPVVTEPEVTDIGVDADSGALAAMPVPVSTAVAVNGTVPESGVPGLESTDRFCAAWSRFGGSWQVLQVAAFFGSDPDVVMELEVIASPLVVGAFDDVFDAWPDELEPEREVVRSEFFGVFQRRADEALRALGGAGAEAADLERLAGAWEGALAARLPDVPVPVVTLDDALAVLVVDAAAEFGRRT
ncbi:MAG: hypothetical protein RLZZ01_2018, partial [Actinomycetota bacterium]